VHLPLLSTREIEIIRKDTENLSKNFFEELK
jgi:hypothetical protein